MFAKKIVLAMFATLVYIDAPMGNSRKKVSQIDERVEVTLGIRVPRWVADFYKRQAEAERRKVSAVARFVLVDYAEKKRAA